MSVVTMLKSSSDGEILDRPSHEPTLPSMMIDTGGPQPTQHHHHSTSGGKLRRAFTMPRNPFTTNRRKIKNNRDISYEDNSNINQMNNNNNNKNTTNEDDSNYNHINNNHNKKPFRRPSIKKFLTKMVQHLSTVTVHNKPVEMTLCPRDPDRVPGVTGLRNHGNTCFINAVLQCLSHTDILAEYFVLDQYKVDLSRRNKLNAKKYGTRGEVTEQLALLLKSIWSCQYTPELSNQFKVLVDKYGSQYRGNNQHDAQEFLVWLLDKVHEDLNTATKKRYKTIKNSFGRPDAVVASETLANHARCNNSFVQAVFQAQFRSSLTCPRCNAQSNTFDPFLCVSVPLPQEQRRPLYVNVLYTSQQPRQVKLGLSVPVTADVRELRDILASDTGIDVTRMLLTELDDEGFHRTFSDSQPVAAIKEWEPIYCLELPNESNNEDHVTQEEREATLLLCWTNLVMGEDSSDSASSIRFGSPYTMQVGRETSYEDLQKLMLKEMAPILHDDVLTSQQEVPAFAMRICDGLGGNYLDPGVDHPLYMEAVEQAIALCQDDSGPPHLKLVLEWTLATKEKLIADDTDQMEELASVKQLKNNSENGGAVSLEECFELYTRAEVLGAEDAWHCPNCNRKQEVVKKLGLWSLPDILVIHLKRFRQSKQRSTAKLTTLVNFPLYGFDMSPHLAQPSHPQDNYPSHPPSSGLDSSGGGVGGVLGGLGWSPWKRPRRHLPRLDDNVYDLYAICNHHGSDLQGGHYTAFCRNPYDTQWYQFDDAKVTPLIEQGLATPAAYILFYQRRGLVGSSTAPGSSAASTSSSGSGGGCGTDHWVYRMPPFHNPAANISSDDGKATDEEIKLTPKEEDTNVTGTMEENFQRNTRTYSTLQPQSITSRRSVATETDDQSVINPLDESLNGDITSQQKEGNTLEKPNELTHSSSLQTQRSTPSSPGPIITESCV